MSEMGRARRLLIGELSLGRLARSVLTVLVLAYLGLVALGHFGGDALLFRPQAASYRDGGRILKIPTRDGARISAVYLPSADAAFTVLLSHGNGEDLGDVEPILMRLVQAGFSVLAYDYRGYGTSGGSPGVNNARRDLEAAFDHLTDALAVPPGRVVLHGRSLGGAFAAELAAERPVAGLILESTFVSMFRVLTGVRLLLPDRLVTLERLRHLSCPVLIVHGTEDEVIGFWHGKALLEATRGPKRHLWVEGAGHNDLAEVAGEAYVEALRAFGALLHEKRPASE
jgi:abhydrolase domain-containing protein 17